MKIVEDTRMIEGEPVLTLEICCKDMKDAILRRHNFEINYNIVMLNEIQILYCPFCGQGIEYIYYEA